MTGRDYQRALCVMLGIEPCHGYELKRGESELRNRLEKVIFRNTFLCLSANEKEIEHLDELKMFRLGQSLTRDAQQRRKVDNLRTIIANQQSEIEVQKKENSNLQSACRKFNDSSKELQRLQDINEKQRLSFFHEKQKLNNIIKCLNEKSKCLVEVSPYMEMYKRSEERRRNEVSALHKSVRNLERLTIHQRDNFKSLIESTHVMRDVEALEVNRRLNIYRQVLHLLLNKYNINTNDDDVQREYPVVVAKEYVAVIQELGKAVGYFEEKAMRDRTVIKELLDYAELFKVEAEESHNAMQDADSKIKLLQQKVKDLEKKTSYTSRTEAKIDALKDKLKEKSSGAKE